ncbi:MAG TPA: hypothetical protein VFM38_08065 [Candidatus Limnocylindrales bacterium]|nr:hypothetical protein [Candidatus Limnocylindrales bacterium]
MTPLVPIIVGLVALALGVAILRSFGMRFRVGQILAVAPVVSVAEARSLAAGKPRYVAIQGRIDAADEFEDDAHRPLVFRRIRMQLGGRGGWQTIDDQRQAVDFEVREGLDAIAVDHAALDDGLVVLPRESVGTVADAPDRAPAGTPPSTPLRLRVEQISSVEHAIVAGVPSIDAASGTIRMTSGLGRPLILTTLERDEAMRVLAGDAPRRPFYAVILLAVGAFCLAVGILWTIAGLATGAALAASPEPSAVVGGDPRSSGQGPGLVGDPLTAIVLVLVIGIGTALATAVYVRMTGGRRT